MLKKIEENRTTILAVLFVGLIAVAGVNLYKLDHNTYCQEPQADCSKIVHGDVTKLFENIVKAIKN